MLYGTVKALSSFFSPILISVRHIRVYLTGCSADSAPKKNLKHLIAEERLITFLRDDLK